MFLNFIVLLCLTLTLVSAYPPPTGHGRGWHRYYPNPYKTRDSEPELSAPENLQQQFSTHQANGEWPVLKNLPKHLKYRPESLQVRENMQKEIHSQQTDAEWPAPGQLQKQFYTQSDGLPSLQQMEELLNRVNSQQANAEWPASETLQRNFYYKL